MTDLQESKSRKPAGKLNTVTLSSMYSTVYNSTSLVSYDLSFYYFVLILTDTAFKQQRLPAWQPILTARNVMPIFFGVAVAFIPIGIGLLYLTNLVSINVL